MRDLIYDIETYKNLFSAVYYEPQTDIFKVFEMSPWKNDWVEFQKFTHKCSNGLVRWVGFNNYFFDYPVIHFMLSKFKLGKTDGAKLAAVAHDKANRLIRSNRDDKFNQIIWDNNQLVPQVDLFRIHHFDNKARMTSLKVLEFNMRSDTVEDLPYDPSKPLTYEQSREVIEYNKHDVRETYRFYQKSKDMIAFREKLTKKLNKNFLNHNDAKIGKDYFIMELEKANIKCYTYDNEGRKPVQTKRDIIKLRDVVFPYIEFKRPEFNAVSDWIKKQKITETKCVFTELDDCEEFTTANSNKKKVKGKIKNLNCVVDGFQFDFGTGGIHGSVPPTIVSESETHTVLDYDVTSLYPSISIVNEIYPKHMTRKFCSVYSQLKEERMSYAKGTPENAMLKLALNGVCGDSNNQYSPFYDPQYTMTITINGQLMLCMLAEMYMEIGGLEIIQINTDGITLKVRRELVNEVEAVNKKWSEITKLDLERTDYKRMFIRDVNNYIGQYTDGDLKRKGAYKHDVEWYQNHSSLIVQKAAEAHLVDGVPIREFIENHDDTYDFMLRTKVPRSSKLMCDDEQIQNTTRYYISKDGGHLVKIMPPLPKAPEKWRHFRQHVKDTREDTQWSVTPMNVMGDVVNIDYDYYVIEVQKLTQPLYDGLLDGMLE